MNVAPRSIYMSNLYLFLKPNDKDLALALAHPPNDLHYDMSSILLFQILINQDLMFLLPSAAYYHYDIYNNLLLCTFLGAWEFPNNALVPNPALFSNDGPFLHHLDYELMYKNLCPCLYLHDKMCSRIHLMGVQNLGLP